MCHSSENDVRMRTGSLRWHLVLTLLLMLSAPHWCQGGFIQMEVYGTDHVIVPGLDVSNGSAIFTVRCCQDIRVSMQKSASSVTSAYEINLGGGGNTYSDINRGFFTSGMVRMQTPNIASCTEAREFWLSWTNKMILVGKGSVVGNNVFMLSGEAPSYPVVALSVASWNTVKGSFSFKNGSDADNFVSLYTRDDLDYRSVLNYNLKGKDFFTFSLKACSDASVRLEPAKGVSASSWYDVIIGGWSNSQSAIRKGGNIVVYSKDSLLDCNSQRQFWISWNDGHIRMGALGTVSQHILLDYVDVLDVYPVGTISVFTGWGSNGNWYFY